MKSYFVVTGIVENNGKFLLLKKSSNDYNYPNKWSFCSGYVKEFEPAEDTVIREIKEEIGLDARIVRKGKLFEKPDKRRKRNWVIMPFLCSVKSRNVRLDHENQVFVWIDFKDIRNYQTVPGLEKDLKELGLK